MADISSPPLHSNPFQLTVSGATPNGLPTQSRLKSLKVYNASAEVAFLRLGKLDINDDFIPLSTITVPPEGVREIIATQGESLPYLPAFTHFFNSNTFNWGSSTESGELIVELHYAQ